MNTNNDDDDHLHHSSKSGNRFHKQFIAHTQIFL